MSKPKDRPEAPRYLLPKGCKDLIDALGSETRSGLPTVFKRVVPLCLLAECLAGYLEKNADPDTERIFFIELSPDDFVAVWPENVLMILRNPEWADDVARVKQVAPESGLTLRQELSSPRSGIRLLFHAALDAGALARAVATLLEEGFQLPSDLPVKLQSAI